MRWRKQRWVEAMQRCGFSWNQLQAEPMRSSRDWIVTHSTSSFSWVPGIFVLCISLPLAMAMTTGCPRSENNCPGIFKLGAFNWWMGILLRRVQVWVLSSWRGKQLDDDYTSRTGGSEWETRSFRYIWCAYLESNTIYFMVRPSLRTPRQIEHVITYIIWLKGHIIHSWVFNSYFFGLKIALFLWSSYIMEIKK